MVTRYKKDVYKPKAYMNVTVDYSEMEPTSLKKALSNSTCLDSMRTKYNALLKNKTQVLVPPLSKRTIIVSYWIFHVKKLAFGLLDKRKSRVVAQGYKQVFGFDFLKPLVLYI